MAKLTLTPQQQAVVENRGGSLLVSAAAGSGKTKVLVDRLFRYVTEERCNIDDFLIITYTKAAAAELRSKIASELSKRLGQTPGDQQLRRQLLRVYQADIKTVDAFCTSLLRENTHLLAREGDSRALTPDFRVLDDNEAQLIRQRVLSRTLEDFYDQLDEGRGLLADTLGAGRDDSRLAALVLELYDKVQSHADPAGWLAENRTVWGGWEGGFDDTPYAAELLADLQSRNERMFLLTFLIVNTAPTRERLENDIFTVNGIAQKYNCAVKRLDWQQEQGYMSSLALGYNGIEIQRGMTTSSTAIFVPFMTRELRMDGPSLYYGMNALSHNVIMADRKKLKSANGLYLGSTGSGKSFAAKRELLNVFLAIPQDRIIVVDPMGEYAPLVERLGGQVIEIAPDSPNHISPMDVQMDMGGGDSPLSLKADFLLSLCELVVGGRDGLQPIEKTVIDRCVRQVYREMALGLETAKTPLLQDLYEELLRQPEPEAKRIATALELYCTGSLNLFNHPTNVNLNSRVVCFVLKGMGENLRKIAMHITNDFVTSAVGANFKNGVATWCYFDEFHILLRDPLTASYFVTVWKMLRKQGCVPSALTQNVKDLLASREIENILDNTDFMVLLSQAQSDRAILAKQIGISEHQLSYITQSNSGEGLLFYGSVTIPFVDRFPRGEIYDLLTTKPEDAANGKQAE